MQLFPDRIEESHHKNHILSLLILVTILVAGIFSSMHVVDSFESSSAIQTVSPIKHVVVIMQENRPFDNFFWTYPGVMGGQSTNSTYCIPYRVSNPSDCVYPSLSTNPAISGDLSHSARSSVLSYDNGLMNGFLQSANGNLNSTVYYNNETIPTYWSYAEHYTLEDNSYSSVLSYSQPNHWYMIAGDAPKESIYTSAATQLEQCVTNGKIDWSNCIYLQEANQTQTIVSLLESSKISWRYYDAPIGDNYTASIIGNYRSGFAGAYQYWDPLAAIKTSYSIYSSHFVWRGQFLKDISAGNLPAVSWVIPAGGISDHSPASLALGQVWVADVINAIMNSKYWSNTAIFLAWDDYGGLFDVIAPPSASLPITLPTGQVIDLSYVRGFRIPMIVISPYSHAGYIDNTLYSFESILRFIEWDYGITAQFSSPLQQANVADANFFGSTFNFNQQPLPRDIIPLNATQLGWIHNCLFQNCNLKFNPNGDLQGQGSSDNYTAFLGDDPD